MGKIEYDVYADGKKIGTASRDKTELEETVESAAAELRYREARLSSVKKSADRLATQYEKLSNIASGKIQKSSSIKEEIDEAKESLNKSVMSIVILLFVGVLGIHRFISGPKWVGYLYLAVIGTCVLNILPINYGAIVLLILLVIDFICLMVQIIKSKSNIKKLQKKYEEAVKKESAKKGTSKKKSDKTNNSNPSANSCVVSNTDVSEVVENLLEQ